EHRAFHDASLLSVRTFPNAHPGTVNPGHGAEPVLIDAPSTDAYAAWMVRAFPDPADRADPAVSGPLADPRREGITNLMRYGLEIDPAAPGLDRLPQVALHDGLLSIRFHRDPAKTDLAYLVEATENPGQWDEVLYDSRIHPQPNNDGPFMRIADPASATASPRFLRLRIILLDQP
ncbi:MAG: hypothetical protein EA425_18500, partial [Puniceicoccaceae bacterium]